MTRNFHFAVISAGAILLLCGCEFRTPYGRRIPRPDASKTHPGATEIGPGVARVDQPSTTSGNPRVEVYKPYIVDFPQPSGREVVAGALSRIGKPAVPELVRVLQHRDPAVRREAAEVLSKIGPDAVDAVPYLTTALDDPSDDVRKEAARALGQIGPAAAAAVPALMRALVEPTPSAPSSGS